MAKHHKDDSQSLGNIQLSLAAQVDGLTYKAALDIPRQASVGSFGKDEGDSRQGNEDQPHHATCHGDDHSALAGIGGGVVILRTCDLSKGVGLDRIEGGGNRFLEVLVDVGDLGLILLVGPGHQSEEVPVSVVVVARHFPVEVTVLVHHGSVGIVHDASLKGHALVNHLITVGHTVRNGSYQHKGAASQREDHHDQQDKGGFRRRQKSRHSNTLFLSACSVTLGYGSSCPAYRGQGTDNQRL